MTEYEAYQEHIRYTHDTYCRIVIRHASFDAARMLAARWKREISLEYLTEEKFVPLSTISKRRERKPTNWMRPAPLCRKSVFRSREKSTMQPAARQNPPCVLSSRTKAHPA